jgi:hypothetical protein
MAGKLVPTAAQDGDGAMPSAPPKLGGGAKSKNQLRRMKAKAKKLADQGVSAEEITLSDEHVEVDEKPVSPERWIISTDKGNALLRINVLLADQR